VSPFVQSLSKTSSTCPVSTLQVGVKLKHPIFVQYEAKQLIVALYETKQLTFI